MATSIQRIIIVLFIIDFLFVTVGLFINNHSDPTLEAVKYESSYEEWNKDFRDYYPETNPDTSNNVLETEVMDSKFGGMSVFRVLEGGINLPDESGCAGFECESTAGVWVYTGIGILILLINLLGAYEIFQIFYAKKYT